MMKRIISFLFLCIILGGNHFSLMSQEPIDYVNMFVGSTGKHKTEYGGTTPAVSAPFGMTQWCAATRLNKISRTMYHYDDNCLLGFMASHQASIWMGDYGFFTMMPQAGELKISSKDRSVPFSHKDEIATPYYYKVHWKDKAGLSFETEFTATSRSSCFRIQYPKGEKALLMLEAGREKEGGSIEIFPDLKEIHIYNKERHDRHLGPALFNFKGYYVLKFSNPFKAYGTWTDDKIQSASKEQNGSHVGGYVEFDLDTDCVEVRIGSSFIDFEQASQNMQREVPANLTFSQIKAKSKASWVKNFNKIQIKGATEEDLSVFYTAFFRTMQYPREFSEYGRYYSAFDDRVHEGVSYNAYSLWDTFRAQHPLLQLLHPERVSDMVKALVQMYEEGGWIPKWPNPSYTNIMIGTHADAVIADAFVNGFRDYDVEKAYEAIRKDAYVSPRSDYRWGDRHYWNGSYEARAGLNDYIQLGYVAADRTNESVSRTMEFGVDDYAIAQMAKTLGKASDYEDLMRRSLNFRNLYNFKTGFFQAKKKDGSWASPNEGFTEGGPWTYRFCVMQRVPELIKLMGGDEVFKEELDKNFEGGHYRHDNEPGHHFVYLYDFCDRLDVVQERIPAIISENYQNKPDGLTGNDDCGQMSAWYLFSALGFYPLAPASGEYALGVPRFKEITISLENHNKLKIVSSKSKTKEKLPSVYWNGECLSNPFIPIQEVFKGGLLEFRCCVNAR